MLQFFGMVTFIPVTTVENKQGNQGHQSDE